MEDTFQTRIIGGLFGLECPLPQKSAPFFLTGRDVFLSNGRSAFGLLVEKLQPRKVWVPSFLCHTILEGIGTGRTEVRFFGVDYDLGISSRSWIEDVAAGDLVILIDYFGFPFDAQLASLIRERKAWVVEDACQSMLSRHVGRFSDFVVFSLRKWIGVPDGAILRFPEGMKTDDIVLEEPVTSWWLTAVQATLLRREFDAGFSSREWYQLYREMDATVPVGPYAMSHLTRDIFSGYIDYDIHAQKRLDNYRFLLEKLGKYAVFPRLEPDVVPLGFPVCVDRRDHIRQALFSAEIYPPVHWEIDGIVPPDFEESHRLSHDIMTLPCDQRYSIEDMSRMARIFQETTDKINTYGKWMPDDR
jgi:dTDP-4-amino-4,6-dideoxygalactose transaminase